MRSSPFLSRAPRRHRAGGPLLRGLLLACLVALSAAPAAAQDEPAGDEPGAGTEHEDGPRKRKGMNPFFERIRKSRYPHLPRPPLSPAWKNDEALRRGRVMKARLLEAAGGWEAFRELGGVRYDMLKTTRTDTGIGPDRWRVHHYQPKLCHFDASGNGYVYTEYAKPSLTGPDFVREVLFDEVAWREMRGGYKRSYNAHRTAWAAVRLEELTGLMPFSLEMLDAQLAFIREEEADGGPVEVYALRLAEDLVLNYYSMMVDEFGIVDEYLIYVRPEEPRVIQLRFAFPDESVVEPPHLRWWYMDFEGRIAAGESCSIPHKRFRWLSGKGFKMVEELWTEDVVPGAIPPAALRRPWQTDGVYDMPHRADFWDPPDGVTGLSGHGTGVPHPPPGTYPPDHPKNRGKFPPLEKEGDSDSAGGGAGSEEEPAEPPR